MKTQPEKLPLTNFDTEQSMAVVWQMLHAAREDLFPEGDECYDEQWDEVCTAMAWIDDALKVPQDGELERISLVEAMEAAADMNQAATDIQHAISTPELRELIDILETLYEPADD